MADNQKELKDLYETGVTDRQMEAAKKRYAEDMDTLSKEKDAYNDNLPKGKGLIFVDPKNNEIVKKSQEAERAKMLDNIKKSMSGPNVPGEYKKKGGAVKYKKGGSVSSASKRADGCAVKGKTKGRII